VLWFRQPPALLPLRQWPRTETPLTFCKRLTLTNSLLNTHMRYLARLLGSNVHGITTNERPAEIENATTASFGLENELLPCTSMALSSVTNLDLQPGKGRGNESE